MAEKHSTNQTRTSQTPGLAERLVEHAGNVRNPTAKAMAEDMREAARIMRNFWVGIHEAIESTKDDDTRARLTKLVEGA